MKKKPLKYLFVAEFTDKSFYRQNKDDASLYFPPQLDAEGKLQGKSCYTDIMEEQRRGKVLRVFSLINNPDVNSIKTKISIDLGTGIFYVNGLPILLESKKLPKLPEKFELMYFRQHTHDLNANYVADDEGKFQLDTVDEKGHFVEHFIGWKCKIAGIEYKETMAIS